MAACLLFITSSPFTVKTEVVFFMLEYKLSEERSPGVSEVIWTPSTLPHSIAQGNHNKQTCFCYGYMLMDTSLVEAFVGDSTRLSKSVVWNDAWL